MGTVDARPSPEGSLRDRRARRHDDRLARSAWYLLRHEKRGALRINRRRQNVEEDSRRSAGDRLRKKRHGRGAARHAKAEADKSGRRHAAGEKVDPKTQRAASETQIVSITFHIPGPLRPFTGGRGSVEIEASPSSLRDALEPLCMLHPGVRDRIVTEQGQVREHINIFVGNEDTRYTGGLATPVPPGA